MQLDNGALSWELAACLGVAVPDAAPIGLTSPDYLLHLSPRSLPLCLPLCLTREPS